MGNLRTLANARVSKKDEFYTQLETIEEELDTYGDYFNDKVVYCNADNALESNFFYYFLKNFKRLGLKKLISSAYVDNDYNLFNIDEDKDCAMSFEYSGGYIKEEHLKDRDIMAMKSVKVTQLKGDGDFRSEESIDLLKKADVIVTNPPFSLFKEYIETLASYNKKFLILGNTNAITYKDFFLLLRNDKVWPGGLFNKTVEFEIPSSYDTWDRIDDDTGKKYAKVPAISWWTNIKRQSSTINTTELTESYSDEYPRYCNYDAIDINKIKNIPKDYDGVMGVPITYIGIHNPEEFEILGLGAGEMHKELGGKVLGEEFINKYFEAGGKGNYVANQNILGYYNKDGEPVIPYMRILIRKHNKKGD